MQLFFGAIASGIFLTLLPIDYSPNIKNGNSAYRHSQVNEVKLNNRNISSDSCFKNARENIDTSFYILLEMPCEMNKSSTYKKSNVIARYGEQIDDDTFIAIEISNSPFPLVNNKEGVTKAIDFLLKKENLTDLGNVLTVERIKIKAIEGVKILHTANVKTNQGILHDKYISFYLFQKGKYLIVKYYAGSKMEIKRDIYFKKWEKRFEAMAKTISITK